MPKRRTSLFPAVHIHTDRCSHCRWKAVCLVKGCGHEEHGVQKRVIALMQFHLYDAHNVDKTYANRYRKGEWP